MYGVPVTLRTANTRASADLPVDDFSRAAMDKTLAELEEERAGRRPPALTGGAVAKGGSGRPSSFPASGSGRAWHHRRILRRTAPHVAEPFPHRPGPRARTGLPGAHGARAVRAAARAAAVGDARAAAGVADAGPDRPSPADGAAGERPADHAARRALREAGRRAHRAAPARAPRRLGRLRHPRMPGWIHAVRRRYARTHPRRPSRRHLSGLRDLGAGRAPRGDRNGGRHRRAAVDRRCRDRQGQAHRRRAAQSDPRGGDGVGRAGRAGGETGAEGSAARAACRRRAGRPEIKESKAGRGESSTYEARDTLGSKHDEELFDYYATSQLAMVDVASGRVHADRQARRCTPTSTSRPTGATCSWRRSRPVFLRHHVRPLRRTTSRCWTCRAANVAWSPRCRSPIAFPCRACRPARAPSTGAPTRPATLTWAEALDGGDWKVKVPARDKVMMQTAPFDAPPRRDRAHRAAVRGLRLVRGGQPGAAVGARREHAHAAQRCCATSTPRREAQARAVGLVDRRKLRQPGLARDARAAERRVRRAPRRRCDLSRRSRRDPPTATGRSSTASTSPTRTTERLFRSAQDAYERFLGFAADGTRLVTWHQSTDDPPNAFLRTPGTARQAAAGEPQLASTAQAVTHYPDPTPAVRTIKKRW